MLELAEGATVDQLVENVQLSKAQAKAIFLNYTMGTANLGRLGALVHQSRSVESLAQADTMCFAQAGILTGTHV